MSKAIAAQGTVFKWNGNEVGEVVSISGPSEKADILDVTSLNSTYHEFIASLCDAGEISLDCNFTPDASEAQIAMYDDFQEHAERPWVIEMPDGTSLSGNGIISSWSMKFTLKDAISVSIGIKITGAVTLTPAGS